MQTIDPGAAVRYAAKSGLCNRVHGEGFHEQTELSALVGECFMRKIGTHAAKVKIIYTVQKSHRFFPADRVSLTLTE